MKEYNSAIIGCGVIHPMHVNAIAKSTNVKLAAVADIDEAIAKKSAARIGCDFYTDYRELLKQNNIDAVHICTPHYLHAPMAIEAMKAGKHVFTEKLSVLSIPLSPRVKKYKNRDEGSIPGKSVGFMFSRESVKTEKAKLDAIAAEFPNPYCMDLYPMKVTMTN